MNTDSYSAKFNVRQVYPTSYCYRNPKEFLVASTSFGGSIIGRGKSARAAWADAAKRTEDKWK